MFVQSAIDFLIHMLISHLNILDRLNHLKKNAFIILSKLDFPRRGVLTLRDFGGEPRIMMHLTMIRM